MDIFIKTLQCVSSSITSPVFIFLLLFVGIIFYKKNKKVVVMQKMIIGESLSSSLELTLSQIVLGILAGVLGSLLLSYLGVVFNNNSTVYIMFLISILLMNIKSRFICFSYSGAVLGIISILNQMISEFLHTNYIQQLNINIISLVSLVGVLHIIEGILVIIDGSRGAVPVFANKGEKIIGGFALKRYWALPIAIFIMLGNNANSLGEIFNIPQWWPILKGTLNMNVLKNIMLSLFSIYVVIGYNSITFTKTKRQKSLFSGITILIYGTILICVSQLAVINMLLKIFVVIFMPLAHELLIGIDKYTELKGQPKFISKDEGIMILDVAPNTPASEMGLECGDLLVEINNKIIKSEKDIISTIREFPNYAWFKILKKSGELKEVSFNKLNKNKRLGAVFIPKSVPQDSKIVKVNSEKFKDILDRIKNKNNN